MTSRAPAARKPAAASPSDPSTTAASSEPSSQSQNPLSILRTLTSRYSESTPSRTKLIDAFLVFLVAAGVLQFAYCPFNAFLAGFSATVGQFVLTASLRIQSNPANKADFAEVSPERYDLPYHRHCYGHDRNGKRSGRNDSADKDYRAFADFVFGSVLLHFFCINFIN
ncbi:DAD family-domain-containing protein [Tricharina praecox]|uniref:DAD family-domain-containing protein n=1 Tax=Tricharina praecox TaxID=43433 RepID=UPI00221F74D6|nr:DAD family-domain-containing protein [Tricharina praecox]KAI5846966.1 DAD family-domain-containing protein [Tricharina praecox]